MKQNENISFDNHLMLVGSPADSKLDFFDSCAKAIEGGVSSIELRMKLCHKDEIITSATKLKAITDHYNIPLIINDYIDIAKIVDASGVHLGQSDGKIEEAKAILGKNKIIGATAHNLAEATKAQNEGATYLGVGSFNKTSTKHDATFLSLSEAVKITDFIDIPALAIGGISHKDINAIKGLNFSGVAVVSAILSSENPKYEATKIKSKFFEEEKDFDAAAFDLDGTLLDSLHVWHDIDKDIFSELKITPNDEFYDKLAGLSFMDTAKLIIEHFHVKDSVENVLNLFFKFAEFEYEQNVNLKKGAFDYVYSLHEKGKKLFVITALPLEIASVALKRLNLFSLFTEIISLSHTKYSKRDTILYTDFLEKHRLQAESTIFFDDTSVAINAAKKANIITCGMIDKNNSEENNRFLLQEADYIRTNFLT